MKIITKYVITKQYLYETIKKAFKCNILKDLVPYVYDFINSNYYLCF